MEILYENLLTITWQQVVMWLIGGILIFLAIKKEMEPTLLLPIGFGAILVNIPGSGAITRFFQDGVDKTVEVITGALSSEGLVAEHALLQRFLKQVYQMNFSRLFCLSASVR